MPSSGPTIRLLIGARGLDHGGSQLRMAELVERLHEDGRFRVDVCSPGDGPLRPQLQRAGVRVVVAEGYSVDGMQRYERTVAALTEWSRDRYDAVFGFTISSFPVVDAAVRLGLPCMLRIGENVPLATVEGWLGRRMDPHVVARYREVASSATVVACNSRAAIATQRADGVDARFALIHNGVRVPVDGSGPDRKAEARVLLGLPREPRILICPASIWPVKGQTALVDAFGRIAREHRDVVLVLIGLWGPDDYLRRVRAAAAAHAIEGRVRIEPFARDISPWLVASDVAVFASESESLPTAALESLAHGLPVVSTAVGDMPDVIGQGVEGWLCAPSDPDALASALELAVTADPSALARMQAAARTLVRERFDLDERLRETIERLAAVAGRRLPPAALLAGREACGGPAAAVAPRHGPDRGT